MKRLLNVCSFFLAVIGGCAVFLICFILFIYPKLNTGTTSNTPYPSSQSSDIIQADNTEEENYSLEIQANTEPIKSGAYYIDDVEFWFSDSVLNDVTGRWRISSIASSKDITEYVVDYYNTLFSSNDEIHAVVNFSLNTTSSISVLYDGMLDVAIHEYIDGEEHDAKALFGGMLLGEYWIDTKTGSVENIYPYSTVSSIEQTTSNVIYSQEIPSDNSVQVFNQSDLFENENNFNTYNNTDQQQTTATYVLNTSTLKFHIPTCNDVTKIAPENYSTSSLSIIELEAQGYSKCGHCFR